MQIVFRPDAAFVATGFVAEHVGLISTFVGASQLVVDEHAKISVAKAIPVAGPGFEVFVFVRDAIDVDTEIRKIEIDLERNTKSLEGTLRKLSNEQFMSNAKQEAIEKERGKQAEFEEKLEKGRKHLTLLRTL